VVTNNLFGERLTPLYLMTNKIAIDDPYLHLLLSPLALYATPNGSENRPFLNFCVRKVLAPYCEDLRNVMDANAPGLSAHGELVI
jgi:hypothetical protein